MWNANPSHSTRHPLYLAQTCSGRFDGTSVEFTASAAATMLSRSTCRFCEFRRRLRFGAPTVDRSRVPRDGSKKGSTCDRRARARMSQCGECGVQTTSSRLFAWECGHVFRICCVDRLLRTDPNASCPTCNDAPTVVTWFPRPMYRRV